MNQKLLESIEKMLLILYNKHTIDWYVFGMFVIESTTFFLIKMICLSYMQQHLFMENTC